MNLMGKPPPGLKPPKVRRNPAHLARVAQLPCVCCWARPVQVHHCIHGRHSQRRVPDEQTIPLCVRCHAELHNFPADWKAQYGLDYEHLPLVESMLAGEVNL